MKTSTGITLAELIRQDADSDDAHLVPADVIGAPVTETSDTAEFPAIDPESFAWNKPEELLGAIALHDVEYRH